jgi:pimeloyl-ACP methyl ester carboxylesterase
MTDKKAVSPEAGMFLDAPGSLVSPHTNHLDEAGETRRVLRVWQTASLRRTGERVQYMRFGRDTLRPLLWLHSAEYPMAPPWGLCVDAAEAGFGVVAIRRPGFGETSRAGSVDEEARLLRNFIDENGFENAILIMEGSARPAGLRLAMGNPRIAYSLIVKPAYSNDELGKEVPDWLKELVMQSIKTSAGSAMMITAMKGMGPQRMYDLLSAATADREFLLAHPRDVAEAWQCLKQIDTETFRRNLAFFEPDPLLVPGALNGFPGISVIGADTPIEWRDQYLARSRALGIETTVLPKGFLFPLQECRTELMAILSDIGN